MNITDKEKKYLSNVPHLKYTEAKDVIRSGDILLCSGNSIFSNLIKFATKSFWSHVGFVIRLDIINKIMVMESVETIGVRTVPLSSYVCDYNGSLKGYPGTVLIARHNDFKEDSVHDISSRAVDLLGYPYDNSEIARIAGRLILRAMKFKNRTKELKDDGAYICSEYAYYLFESVHVNIETNESGFITPDDFSRTKAVKPVCVLS